MSLPNIRLTPSAVEQFSGALGPGDFLHLSIDKAFGHDLVIGPKEEGDIAIDAGGLTLLIDAETVGRADGLTIDFVSGDLSGFRFRNPNAPPKVEALPPKEIKALLDEGKLQLFDVRTDAERLIAKVAEARPLEFDYLLSLDRSQPVAFMCHKGTRSESSANLAIKEGFRTVYNVTGGIDAWSITVDRSLKRY